MVRLLGFLAALAMVVLLAPVRSASGNQSEIVGILKTIDERQRTSGDFRANVYIESKEKGKVRLAYGALVMRRSEARKFMILFTKPKTSQGQGYLRESNNLWFYDPSVGRWERRTERERIGGTNSRRSDYDASRLAEEYDPEDLGTEKIGAYTTRVLKLRGKPGTDLAFPVLQIWVDVQSKNILKRQDFALSGRLLRTAYYPSWKKVYSDSKKGDVWYPQEARIYDEIEKENSVLLLMREVSLAPLEANLFTKAWLESKSR